MKNLSDLLFMFAIIGGPILLAVLYIYGANATRQLDKRPGSRDATTRATEQVYRDAEAEREQKELSAERSDRIVDEIERKTGTTG